MSSFLDGAIAIFLHVALMICMYMYYWSHHSYKAKPTKTSKNIHLLQNMNFGHFLYYYILFIILFYGSKAESKLIKQLCRIQTKIDYVDEQWPVMVICLYNLTFLGACLNCVMLYNICDMNSVLKRILCRTFNGWPSLQYGLGWGGCEGGQVDGKNRKKKKKTNFCKK